jgi:hypothetical protein
LIVLSIAVAEKERDGSRAFVVFTKKALALTFLCSISYTKNRKISQNA